MSWLQRSDTSGSRDSCDYARERRQQAIAKGGCETKKKKKEKEEAKRIKKDNRRENVKERKRNEKMKVGDFFVFEKKNKVGT